MMLPVTVSMPSELLQRLDEAVERERARLQGIRFTRSDLLRQLLTGGLNVLDSRAKAAAK